MINIKEELFQIDPYSLKKNDKENIFFDHIKKLNAHHIKYCKGYKKIMNFNSYKNMQFNRISDYPFLPALIFKMHSLKSVKTDNSFKEIYSSGTSSNAKSKIYLDSLNSKNQIKVLNILFSKIIGKNRLPMIFAEQKPSEKEINSFNAKAAAIYGFSIFGNERLFLLNKNNEINYSELETFLKKNSNSKFIIFGFTSSIYNNLINKINSKKINFSMENAILIHGGGWKKLENKKISNRLFKKKLESKFKIKKIINYYGTVEQTGSIFFECKCGFFHTSTFSDVIIRNKNLEVENIGKEGLVQLISLLPTSYPGHNILTEDLGTIYGEDDCECGQKGKYFLINGRAKQAELRGCSDV
jgi:hypothetical protein|tara:strand:- start:11595 stop:12662 length:1068 start_codon:yes stop_codon:yes gene_type:complete